MDYSFFINRSKYIIRQLVSWVYYYLSCYKLVHEGKVLILMYHRVIKDKDDAKEYLQPGMYVSESSFKKQMEFINRNYIIISLNSLIDAWKKGDLDKCKKYCVVTFDDGWLDNYQNAYPILKQYNIPATIFLATSYVGTNRWFWPDKLSHLLKISNKQIILKYLKNEYSELSESNKIFIKFKYFIENNNSLEGRELIDAGIETFKEYPENEINKALNKLFRLLDVQLPLKRITLNWEEIHEMSNNGISFGSHTCNHKILTTISTQEVDSELKESIKTIKAKNINYVSVFCYPNGNYNKTIESKVKDSGYEAAVTTKYGFENAINQCHYKIKRVGVHDDVSSTMALFAFHISGLHQLLRN